MTGPCAVLAEVLARLRCDNPGLRPFRVLRTELYFLWCDARRR